MTIKITVNDDGTISADPRTKDKDKGKDTITWELKTKGYKFVEPGVNWGTQKPPTAPGADNVFSNMKVKDTKITVDDDNPGGSTTDYPYTLNIVPDSKDHASKFKSSDSASMLLAAGDPIIRNGPGRGA